MLDVPADMSAKLDTLAQSLSRDFGFTVTPTNTIGYLLRQYERWTENVVESKPTDDKLFIMDREAEALMRKGEKILAIKLVRERASLGLKEAKDYVESRWQHLIPPTSSLRGF